MKSHLMMLSSALLVTTVAFATNVPSEELSSTFEVMAYDVAGDLTVAGDVADDVVDVAFEGFTVTLTPDNMLCGDPMWPSFPGFGGTAQGCGTAVLADGTTGLYIATDDTPGSAASRNNLYIETVDGDTLRFNRGGTGCDASEYRYKTHKQKILIIDSGTTQAIGTGALCFDAVRWDL